MVYMMRDKEILLETVNDNNSLGHLTIIRTLNVSLSIIKENYENR